MATREEIGAFVPGTDVHIDGAAEGPLEGLTFAAKDIFDIAGHITGCGNPDWARTHGPAQETAPAVQRLLDAGATLVGKTITEELAFSLTGENAHYGAPVNVNAPGRVSGGSSSGSAAAVAAGLVDFALGSDTAGSVRVPASFCGIYGLRPTHDRVPIDHVMPLSASLDTVGWFARDGDLLRDIGAVLLDDRSKISAGPFLVAGEAIATVDAPVREALMAAIERLRGLLGKPETVAVADLAASQGLDRWAHVMRTLQGGEAWATHGAWIESVKPAFGAAIAERFKAVSQVAAADIAECEPERVAITEHMETLLADGAILAVPAAPTIAPLRGSSEEVLAKLRGDAQKITCIAGLARLPQISLPLCEIDGCPLALGLIAAGGNDGLLLDIAAELSAT
ncbi:MAG: amidase [Alphaproteobacteria bacterium]|jgi:amidase